MTDGERPEQTSDSRDSSGDPSSGSGSTPDSPSRFRSVTGRVRSLLHRVGIGGSDTERDSDSNAARAGGPNDTTGSRSIDLESTDPFTRRVNPLITNRPWTVVLVFLLLTGVFFGMTGAGEQEAGSDQFTEDLEAQEAYESMQENFNRGSRSSGGTTAQLFISDDRNVLSKPNLLRMLEFQDRIESENDLYVESSTSPASLVATQLDPEVETPEEQYRAVEQASQRQLEAAIATADETAGLPVSTDFTRESATAEVSQVAITYDTPSNMGQSEKLERQKDTLAIADDIDGFDADDNLLIFSGEITSDEQQQLLGDTAIIVFPASLVLILFFLLVAYRDPIDLGLGLVALVMTMIWTFGFMGLLDIPFSESLLTVFPLLLAVGIDFGIHIINRYREERAAGAAIGDAMGITTRQLNTALLIVTLTTVFSFSANLLSDLTRDFGIVASAGIIFTFLIFGVFVPAGKVGLDRLRKGTRFPSFGTSPLGSEHSLLGRVLPVGVHISRAAPVVFLVVMLVVGASAAAYGSGVDTEFDDEAFFPDEERIERYESLPEPFAPSDYSFMQALEHMEEDFDRGLEGSITIYVEDPDLRDDDALRELDRALEDPPEAFKTTENGRYAEANSILDTIDSQRAADPEFAATVDRYDSNGDRIPDRNVDAVYDELFATAPDQAANRLTTDRSATRLDVQIDVDTEQDEAVAAGRQLAEEMRLDATATGQLVIFEAVIEKISESTTSSLVTAFLLTMVFLVFSYWWLEGRAIYGVINLVPVLLAVALLAGSMRYFGVPLSPINAPVLSVSIGLGVDYTVHFMHRFVDEYERTDDADEALLVTVRGTGGALTGSMLTTVCGLGVLYFALIPMITDFGLLLGLGVFYCWLASIVILPSVIVVWDRLEGRYGALTLGRLSRT